MVGRTAQPVSEIIIAGRQVAMWKPAGAPLANGYPIIVFSHGFTGCGTQSVFLTEALAQAGYLVLAPDHRDAACGPGHEGKLFEKLSTMRSEEPFHDPGAWTEATYRDRGADLEAILDTILKEKSFQGVAIDSSRIGLAGHSLGGYTVLALAGAWPSWKDRRVKAVLGLSPYCAPFILKGDLGHLDVPIMYQGGTLDIGISPYVRRPGGAYDLTSAPKYFLDLAGAGHFAWTNLNKSYQSIISDYAVAFFDRYLKGTPGPLAHLLDRPWPKDVSDLKYGLK
jgi:predicted dienelactone hydrolase